MFFFLIQLQYLSDLKETTSLYTDYIVVYTNFMIKEQKFFWFVASVRQRKILSPHEEVIFRPWDSMLIALPLSHRESVVSWVNTLPCV